MPGAGGAFVKARGKFVKAGSKFVKAGRAKAVAGRAPTRSRAAARSAAGSAAGEAPAAGCELPATALRWSCPPIKPSSVPPSAVFLLGQERPMTALHTGLAIHAPGYNLFVSGLMGSGRTTVVERLLRDIQPVCRRVPDRLFVTNFREPSQPILVSLPPGKGPVFRDELLELGRSLHGATLAALRSRPHRMSRRVVRRASAGRERRIMDALQRQAQKQGCAVVRFQAPNGATTADIYPVVDGEPITLDALAAMVADGKLADFVQARLLRQREQLLERLDEVGERMREEAARVEAELRSMDRKLAWRVLQAHTKAFVRRWPEPEVADWLDTAGEFLERHLQQFVGVEVDADDDGKTSEVPPPSLTEPRLLSFQAKIVKTSFSDACPVVIETNPTFANLFGTIATPVDGSPVGPMHVLPGAILRAEGGYLVLRCFDVLREPGVWPQLKRTLQTGRLEIREFEQGAPTTTLQPEAIPIDLKVVLIGEPGVYEQLANEDPQFPQIFKIHAEFDTTIPIEPLNLRRYADYLAWLASKEGLRPLSPQGNAAVAEYGARAAGRRDRLITRYSDIGDLAREASHLATQDGARVVSREHVERAIEMQRRRHDLAQELTERDYTAGYMHLTTAGAVTGQINALTVLATGSIEFGRPCRITCSSGVATAQRAGLVNIEGLANLSGPIHDKGVMILEGFLLAQCGREGPLCMQATICFEQLYNGVEGDSASLAQLLALLSSLGEVPLRQGIAVTGSINQRGEVQAVGGVNDKIEGFFRLCRARGLSGDQGVVLPRANVGDLMLDHDVVAAVAAGSFRVCAVSSVYEAIAVCTGLSSDEVLGRVRASLARFRELALGGLALGGLALGGSTLGGAAPR